jgi:hypothetical protein
MVEYFLFGFSRNILKAFVFIFFEYLTISTEVIKVRANNLLVVLWKKRNKNQIRLPKSEQFISVTDCIG